MIFLTLYRIPSLYGDKIKGKYKATSIKANSTFEISIPETFLILF